MDSVFCDSVPHDDLSDYRETGIGAGGHWCAGDTTVVSLRLSDSIRAAAGGSGCNRQISAGSADQRRFYHPVYRRAQSVLQNSLGIVDMGVVLFGITVLSMHIGARDSSTADLRQKPAKIRVPSLGMVLFRRLLHRKSMWISLAAIVVLSSLILRMEQASEVQIRVAVCDESGAFQELLAAYDGLVVFEQYESDAAVQRAVQRGDAECGYVLPETLAAKMTAQHARREILVYQDADAVAVPVVNEILFERIFRQVSCKWFEEYLLQNSVIQKAYGGEAHLRERVTALFHEELTAGTTFRFEIRRIGTLDKAAADDPTVYPVYWVATAAVVLCAIQGIWQVAADLAAQQFYRQNRVVVSAWTFMLPMMLGVLCAVVLILLQ